MHPKSIRTLGQVAILLLVIAALISAPPLRLGLAALAMICACFPAALGSGKWRIVGLVAALLGLILAVATWPLARKHMQKYRTQGLTRP